MVVYDGHRTVIVVVILILLPIVPRVVGVRVLDWAVARGHALKKPIATVSAIQEEVVLLVPIDPHPG